MVRQDDKALYMYNNIMVKCKKYTLMELQGEMDKFLELESSVLLYQKQIKLETIKYLRMWLNQANITINQLNTTV